MNKQAIEDQYLRINKFFGQLVGVWPYQERFTKFCIRLTIFAIIILTLTTQIYQVIVFCTLDALSNQLPYLNALFILLFKQYNYILNEDKLRDLLNDIIFDRLMVRSKKELEILNMYSRRATTLCIFYEVIVIFSAIMFIMIPTIPPILNIIMPLNESRDREFIYPTYFFIDEEKYYYPILTYMATVILIVSSVYLACDTNLVQIVHHGCALLAISGYHFKHAVDDMKFSNGNYIDLLMDETYKKVKQSIKAHKTAVEYVDKIDACHIYYFLLIIGMIVLAFTGTFLKLSTMEIEIRFFTFCGYTVAQLTHLFFLTIMGQFLINANDEIFNTIYEAHWYNGSSRTQSLYVLVLRKCLNPPTLTGGGLIVLNLDSFVQILKLSFSYYTVFRS
ncbi:odorant receptor Or1-like isoform X1 [Apis mellifera caucasica]|uniref:Odorant receptor n=1 Tax=Apis mellifera TaxID=7460 RepID=A0A7M7GQY7_APIME|nr:odorant receptor Or1-like isoform X1 [Apis mellifera]KAG6798092.1 odorant receptor Or1-like isoform X1 [Apis mellifera caucasica]KAG9429865.1 odorant receptor Or1-like isoform X1 [Apis mellifera carnica]|eukprot:XP_006562271.1 odorant receptor Or1-like isoform X1 [Apis mellifera]